MNGNIIYDKGKWYFRDECDIWVGPYATKEKAKLAFSLYGISFSIERAIVDVGEILWTKIEELKEK